MSLTKSEMTCVLLSLEWKCGILPQGKKSLSAFMKRKRFRKDIESL
jgi:hypothetical protein